MFLGIEQCSTPVMLKWEEDLYYDYSGMLNTDSTLLGSDTPDSTGWLQPFCDAGVSPSGWHDDISVDGACVSAICDSAPYSWQA